MKTVLNFVPKGPFDHKSDLDQVLATSYYAITYTNNIQIYIASEGHVTSFSCIVRSSKIMF